MKQESGSDANLHIRLPRVELEAFKREAKRHRMSFSVWVRLQLRRASGFEPRKK